MSSIRAYAGVSEVVAPISVRWPAAEPPMMPMLSGSSPRPGASARTRRMARWRSCHADMCLARFAGRGVRYLSATTAMPFSLR